MARGGENMDVRIALVGLAAGSAVANAVARHWRGVNPGSGAGGGCFPAAGEVPLACPACGADEMAFGFEEEVDAALRAIDVVCCRRCGWKQPLLPL